MLVINGVSVSEGVAVGPLRFLDNKPKDILREIVCDCEREAVRFEEARQIACTQLESLFSRTKEKVGEENAAIFDIQKMMLEDFNYRESIENMIREENVNAEYAVSVAAEYFRSMFSSMDDSYMKERAADVIDVSERVIKTLNPGLYKPFELQEPSILAAIDIAPSEAVQLDRDMILGFVTAEGSAVSHTAILAKSMLIPAVVGVGASLSDLINGKPAILDGSAGVLFIEPDDKTNAEMSSKLLDIRKKRAALDCLRDRPNITLDGKEIDVFVNVSHLSGLDDAVDSTAGGIGLFRSEFLYLESYDFPTEDEQFAAYKKVAESMGGKKVIIRTLDIGADKQAGYFNIANEANPAMGLRAIRICLSRPEIFKTQLRALYRASAFGDIAIMFPMIISTREVEEIMKITEEVMADLRSENIPFNENTKRGIMIETPAAVMISGKLAEMVDFFSIGTNDLTQYTLAIDRQNNEVGCLYDPHHPAVIKMIEMTVKAAHASGIWVGICGELSADLELTETFLRMGVDELSVSAGMVLPLREKIISIDLSHSNQY